MTAFAYDFQARDAVHELIDAAASRFGVSPEEIKGYSRVQGIVDARQWVCMEAHDRGVSTVTIGRVLKRDHTTVMHGIKRARAREAAFRQTAQGRV